MDEKIVQLGDIVIYNTTAEDREVMQGRLSNIATRLPAIVVAEWGDKCVNLKVILDGEGSLWVTSVTKGKAERQWEFKLKAFHRVKAKGTEK